jgi:hypothetical protein
LQELEHFQPISGLLQSQKGQQIVMIQTAHRRALQFQQMRLARIDVDRENPSGIFQQQIKSVATA